MFRHDPRHSGYSTSTAPNTNNNIWNYTTGGWVYSSPAVADGKVYVGSWDNKVYAFGPVHDVAVTTVTPSKTVVGQGYSMSIEVTVENVGRYTETFNVTTYYDDTPIETKTVTNLPPGEETTVTVAWNTTGVAKGNYTLSARATLVTGETHIFTNGEVTVACKGDLTGPEGIPDGTVDMRDISLVARGFGANRVTDPEDPRYGQYWHLTPCATCPHSPNCDITSPTLGIPDGTINMRDISLVASLFGTGGC